MTITRNISVNWGTSGATLYYRVVDADGADLIARTSSGVSEFPAASGCYAAKITTWDADWVGRIVWDDGTSYAVEDFQKTAAPASTAYAGGDTAGVTTLLGRITGAIPSNPLLTTDARLNNLDAAISTRSTYGGADTPGTTTLLSRLPSALTISGGVVSANAVQLMGDSLTGHQAVLNLKGISVVSGNNYGAPTVVIENQRDIDRDFRDALWVSSYNGCAMKIQASPKSNVIAIGNNVQQGPDFVNNMGWTWEQVAEQPKLGATVRIENTENFPSIYLLGNFNFLADFQALPVTLATDQPLYAPATVNDLPPAPDNESIAVIKDKTDTLPDNPAAAGDAMSLTADAIAAVRSGEVNIEITETEVSA